MGLSTNPALLVPEFSNRSRFVVSAGAIVELCPADTSRVLIVISLAGGFVSIGLNQQFIPTAPLTIPAAITPYHLTFADWGPTVGQQWWMTGAVGCSVYEVFWRPKSRTRK